MIVTTDIDFSKRRKRKYSQQGSTHNGSVYRPLVHKLIDFERIQKYDNHVKSSLNILVNGIVGHLDQVDHPDKEIEAFLRYNIAWMLNERGIDYYSLLKNIVKSTLWGGFSISENLYAFNKDGQLLLEDIINYHPASITIRPNKQGRLIEGHDTEDGYKSGIYQTGNNYAETQLSMWKLVYLSNDSQFGNYYGTSILEGICRWHYIKEALVDYMLNALDKFGNPLIAITVPSVGPGFKEIDENGNEITRTAQEILQEQLQTIGTGEGGNVLILPQTDPNLKPEVKVITTGNNLGSMYVDAIEICERQMSKGMIVPYGLVSGNDAANGKALEKHIEIYNSIVRQFHRLYIRPIVNQSLHRLIKFNYSRESANIPPTFPVNSTSFRPEDKVALMQLVKGLTDDGYINASDDKDWMMVRQMVDLAERPMSKEDKEFVKQQVIYPKNPQELPADKLAKLNQKTKPSDPSRVNEGLVKGKGNVGRPGGITTPHETPRIKKPTTES